MDPADLVRTGRDINDPGSGDHQIKKLCREKKMTKVIDTELPLDSLLRLLPVKRDEACVVYKDINTRIVCFTYSAALLIDE